MLIRKLALPIILIAVLSGLAIAATPPGIPDGWSEGYVYANGIRIHYYRATPAPGKPVIVMAHGATDYGLNWTTLTKELQSEYDIYMVDARGHGYTDPPTAESADDVVVKDLVGFTRKMNLEKPILMGHSMGSGTVMRVAAAYPDLPSAVVLLDPGMGPRRAGRGPGAPRGAAPTAAAGRRLRMGGSPEEMVAQNNRPFDDLLAQCRQQTPKWDLLDCEYWAVSKRLYHGSYTSGGTGTGSSASYISNLGKIAVPTLVLKADAPPETRAANEAVAKVLKNGRLVHIDGAGHNLHHDERQQTLKVMREFLGAL